MPDPYKHSALERQGFKIAACGTCVHFMPQANHPARNAWGVCAMALYSHGKHTGTHLAGVPAVGTCGSHETDMAKVTARAGEDYAMRYAWSD